MNSTDKNSCGCENKRVEKKPCDCGGKCGASGSKFTESLEARKEHLEKELKEVNQELNA
jgi:hypothetical protein